MVLFIAFFALGTSFFSYSLLTFKRNVDRVKHLDIPKIFNPLCPSDVVWLLIQPAVLPLIRLLPFSLGKWVRYSKWGWEFEERYQTHAELGDIWMQVTPSMNWVYVADANLVKEIFHRREDFRRPIQLYCMGGTSLVAVAYILTLRLAMLDIFGPNVGTVEGQEWQRHRRITGAAFNEQCYMTVWSESLRQADGMLQWWTSQGLNPISTTAKDVRALSLNVLAHVGFRKAYSFDGRAENTNTQEALSFRQTLCFVLDNALLTMAVPAKFLRLPFLPYKWRQIGQAIDALRHHMTTLYNEEKSRSVQDSQGAASLMKLMVRVSEQATSEAKAEAEKSHAEDLAPKRAGLIMNEIFGNIFVYYFAGHDTTAAVFAYTVYLLAAHPEVQDWIGEELHHVLPSNENSQWRYEDVFPRLKRCLAVLVNTHVPSTTGYNALMSMPSLKQSVSTIRFRAYPSGPERWTVRFSTTIGL